MAKSETWRALDRLDRRCVRLCRKEHWLGEKTSKPNFRLLYSSVESYERSNGVAIIGINPAGGPNVADIDDRRRPFRDPGYSAYLDDEWIGSSPQGQHPLQRVIQELAMILTGATPAEAKAVRDDRQSTPEERIGNDATTLLRNAASGNIIPFRGSKLSAVPCPLRERGEEIGWQVLRSIRPTPRVIVTLANGTNELPWRALLDRSGATTRDAEHDEVIREGRGGRRYRDVKLRGGPLRGALVIGLPAVMRDKGNAASETEKMFTFVERHLTKHRIRWSKNRIRVAKRRTKAS